MNVRLGLMMGQPPVAHAGIVVSTPLALLDGFSWRTIGLMSDLPSVGVTVIKLDFSIKNQRS